MKTSYTLAAALSLFAAIVRTWDGETAILKAARGSIVDQELLGFLHLTWYMETGVFLVAAAALAYLAARRPPGANLVGLVLGALFVTWSGIIAIVSTVFIWHPGTVVPAVVALLTGSLAIIGSRSVRKEAAE